MSDYKSTSQEMKELSNMISLGKYLISHGFNQLDFLVTRKLVKFKVSVMSKLTYEQKAHIEGLGFEIKYML